MPDHEERGGGLRKCPRCGCGLLPTSPICEFCGGVLSHIAVVGNEVSGVICPHCGEQNDPTVVGCRSCRTSLRHTCPRCTASIAADAACCPGCGLTRDGFFDECLRQHVTARAAAARTRRRRAVTANAFALVAVAVLVLVAWWQQLRPDALEWKVWAYVTGSYLILWALSKSK